MCVCVVTLEKTHMPGIALGIYSHMHTSTHVCDVTEGCDL